MAAPIFKFKNVRIPLTDISGTIAYAVDIGRGNRGLDIGVLPEEISSVILTVQCSNRRKYVPNKTITATTGSTTDSLTCTSTADLTLNMPVVFSGTTFGDIVAGTTYYVRDILGPTTFTVSATRTNGIAGDRFNLSNASGTMTAEFDSTVKISVQVRDLVTQTGTYLVEGYSVIASNAFDPLNGNLVLTSNLALVVETDTPNYVDVTVSLLEIANATAS
jgi:hypothetical protein